MKISHVQIEELYCQDANYLLAGDRINDILSLPAEKVKQLTPVLACADRSVKVSCDWWRAGHVTSTLALIGRQVVRDSEVAYTAELPGPPTTLQLFYNDGGEHGDQVPSHGRK